MANPIGYGSTKKSGKPAQKKSSPSTDQVKPGNQPPTVMERRTADQAEHRIEAGVLDTVQSLSKQKLRRREHVTDLGWYTFLKRFLYFVGGPAVVAWIFYGGFQVGEVFGKNSVVPTEIHHEVNMDEIKSAVKEAVEAITPPTVIVQPPSDPPKRKLGIRDLARNQ